MIRQTPRDTRTGTLFPDTTLLRSQAAGSLGRTILDGANRVRIWGQDVAGRAQIRRIYTYSAHADQQDLQRWIKARQPIDGSLFLSHGESGSIETFRRLLQADEIGRAHV